MNTSKNTTNEKRSETALVVLRFSFTMMNLTTAFATERLSPDMLAATLELLDAQDLLRLTVATGRRLQHLPRHWAFPACRPLTKSEQTALIGVGVPHVQLYVWNPTMPEGLVPILTWRCCEWRDTSRTVFTSQVAEDAQGGLYKCIDYWMQKSNYRKWTPITEEQLDHYHQSLKLIRAPVQARRKREAAAQNKGPMLLLTHNT